MTKLLTGRSDPRAQRKPDQSRQRVDTAAMADCAIRALRMFHAGTRPDVIARVIRWPERGRMSSEDIAREALRVARFYDAKVFHAEWASRFFFDTRTPISLTSESRSSGVAHSTRSWWPPRPKQDLAQFVYAGAEELREAS